MNEQGYTVEQYLVDHRFSETYANQVLAYGCNYRGYAVVPTAFGQWARVMVFKDPNTPAVATSGFNSVTQAKRAIKTMQDERNKREGEKCLTRKRK